jgi:hypothetical protein
MTKTWNKHGITKKTHSKHKPLKHSSAIKTHSKHKPLKQFCVRDCRMKQSLKHEAYPHLGHFER